jgi:hypothetical protein
MNPNISIGLDMFLSVPQVEISDIIKYRVSISPRKQMVEFWIICLCDREIEVSSQNEISTKIHILRCACHNFALGKDNFTAKFHK